MKIGDQLDLIRIEETMPHEIGHYKHFLELVGEIEDSPDSEAYEDYGKREDAYHNLDTQVKEHFAHQYADKLRSLLTKARAIPFDRKETPE